MWTFRLTMPFAISNPSKRHVLTRGRALFSNEDQFMSFCLLGFFLHDGEKNSFLFYLFIFVTVTIYPHTETELGASTWNSGTHSVWKRIPFYGVERHHTVLRLILQFNPTINNY